MESNLKLFVSCAIGLEPVLADEMRLLSAEPTLTKAGVHLDVDLETAYRVILWSRVASRVLLPLFETNATGDDLYAEALEFDWSEHLRPGSQIAVEFSGQNKHIRHTRYGALRIKDAIADWFSARDLEAPQMSREEPDMRLSARLNRGQVEVALDLSWRCYAPSWLSRTARASTLAREFSGGPFVSCWLAKGLRCRGFTV